jgi:2-C-methyl-D-erythritol 4-phosphate cytidylyltransferase
MSFKNIFSTELIKDRSMKTSIVIVAGGMGRRLGKSIPKAFVPIANKETFVYSLELFDRMNQFHSIVLVVPEMAVLETKDKIDKMSLETPVVVIAGGAERWESVFKGVNAATDADQVMIHDAARPFVTEIVVLDLLQKIGDSAGVITATPVIDTIRYFDEDRCGTTVDRSKMIAVGTPQLFNRTVLQECFAKIETMESIPTDEAMLLEKCGERVLFSYGDRLNFKVTTPEDLEIAEALLATGAVK